MTEQLEQVLARLEQLPPETQDSIARLIQLELESRERQQHQMLRVLDRMDALRRQRGPHRQAVDAVEIIRAGRDVLDIQSATG